MARRIYEESRDTQSYWTRKSTERAEEIAWERQQAQSPAGQLLAAQKRYDALKADRGAHTQAEIDAAMAEIKRLMGI